MKYAIDREHKHLFNTNKYIEFYDLLSNPASAAQEVDTALAALLNRSERSLLHVPAKEKFLHGRSLPKTVASLKKIATSRNLAEIFAQLTLEKKVRFGFAQLIWGGKEQPHSLSLQRTSLSPVTGAVLLCLCPRNNNTEERSIFSLEAGSAVFLAPEQVIDFTSLEESPLACYLLVVYTGVSTIYREEKLDLLGHFLLGSGYTYGDRLAGPDHPLLIR
jgi:hypothetical protein